jgi:hypothetical protein
MNMLKQKNIAAQNQQLIEMQEQKLKDLAQEQ